MPEIESKNSAFFCQNFKSIPELMSTNAADTPMLRQTLPPNVQEGIAGRAISELFQEHVRAYGSFDGPPCRIMLSDAC